MIGKVKRVILIMLAISMALFAVPVFAGGDKPTEEEIKTVDEALKRANKFLNDFFSVGELFRTISTGNRGIIYELAINGGDSFGGMPILVYGDAASGAEAASLYGNDKRRVDINDQPRALGFTFMDCPYANPKFLIDDITYSRRWIKEPWVLPKATDPNKQIRKDLLPDDPRDNHTYQYMDYTPHTDSTTYSVMRQWIKDESLFTPDWLMEHGKERSFFNDYLMTDDSNFPDVLRDHPEDYIYILQPPTYDSWGIGIAFYYYGGTGANNIEKSSLYSYYQFFRFQPLSLMEGLAAEFCEIPPSAEKFTKVRVGVRVESTCEAEQKQIPFNWEITTEDGAPIRAQYSGHATAGKDGTGEIDLLPAKGERLLYATFTMPESKDVKVKFWINKDGENPIEAELGNNVVEGVINKHIEAFGDINLDYNILSRKVKFPLVTDTVIDAQLQLPIYSSWNGIATGSLDVVNKTTGIYREYSVTNNPDVRGKLTYASRNPDIHTRIYREDLGDDPINRDFADSDPIQNQGKVSFSGEISRPYTYAIPVGKTVITGESTADADFDSGTHINTITANVYNGMNSITKKRFDDIIKNNINGALKKELYWTSEEYSLDVVRLMYHMDEDDSLYDETVVGGRYKRQFTQQCSGTVEWEYVSPMSQEYMRSRKAAKDRSYDSDDYDKAVFATDKDMRNEDYPIKSGYYFNPAGEYKFTVETVTYKPKKGLTQDHKDLVDTVIKSFRYETDLMYSNNSKDAVNIQNEYLQKTPNGNSYRKKPAVLTADDPDGVNGIKILQVIRGTTDINEKRLEHSQQANGYTHEYFKNILEGYSESGTKSSDTSYKYREYIKDGQEIYKITERTEVTIKVNPNNAKVYTHAHMPDGKYYIKVWVDEIDLSGMASAYNKLDILEGISQLDEIKVTVKGSMYDDIN